MSLPAISSSLPITAIALEALPPENKFLAKEPNEPKEPKTPELFFSISEEDQYLELLYRLEIIDRSGVIKPACAEFKLPPLNREAIDVIKKSLEEEILIKGVRLGCPLNIRLNMWEILKNGKRKAKEQGVDHPQMIEYYGGSFHSGLPASYLKEVFNLFFAKFEAKLGGKRGKELITSQMYCLRGALKRDRDYHLKPKPATEENCHFQVEMLLELFEEKLDKSALDRVKISSYLQRLREKVKELPHRTYLKSQLKDLEMLFPERADLFHTLLKVDAFIKSADVNTALKGTPNHFFFRSFGDRMGKKIDILFPSSLARHFIFPIHSLSVYLDRLIEGPNPILIPFGVEGNAFQFFSDNNANLITPLKDNGYEDADWERLILLGSRGARCLQKGFEEHCLDIVIATALREQVDLGARLIKKLKKLADEHSGQDPDQIIALTFRACSSLLLKKSLYTKEIQQIWKEMFYYIDALPNRKSHSSFTNALRTALQDPSLFFEDVYAQMQLSSYFSVNLPAGDKNSAKIVPINAETPCLRVQIESSTFLLPLEPDRSLDHIREMDSPAGYCALATLHAAFRPLISLDGKTESLLKSYAEHESVKWKAAGEKGASLLGNKHPFLNEMGCLALGACLAQKFEAQAFSELFRGVFLSSQVRRLSSLLTLCSKKTAWEKHFQEHSKIITSCKKISSEGEIHVHLLKIIEFLIETDDHNFIKLVIDLCKDHLKKIPTGQDEKFLFKLINRLLPTFLLEASLIAAIANEKRSFDSAAKLRLWTSIADHCLQAQDSLPKTLASESFVDEVIALLENSLLPFEKSEKTLTKRALLWAIDNLLNQTQYNKGHRLLSLAMARALLSANQESATLWHRILQYFLDKGESNGIDAYHCWEEGEKYQIWDYLKPETRHAALGKLNAILPKSPQGVFKENFKENFLNNLLINGASTCNADFKQAVIQAFLRSIEGRLKKVRHFADCEEILYSLANFIKKYPPLHESEENLWIDLFEKIFILNRQKPFDKRQIHSLQTFLHHLLNERFSENLGNHLLKLLATATSHHLLLIPVYFEAALSYLCKIPQSTSLTADQLKSFLASFHGALDHFSFNSPSPNLKKLLKNDLHKTLLDRLQEHQLHGEMVLFLFKLKSLDLLHAWEDNWLISLHEYLKEVGGMLSRKELKITKLLLISREEKSDSKSEILESIHLQLAQVLVKEGLYLEAKNWIEKAKPSHAMSLALQNAAHLIASGETSHGIEQLDTLKTPAKELLEVNVELALFINTCCQCLPIKKCAKLLISHQLFQRIPIEPSSTKPILQRLIKEFRAQRNEGDKEDEEHLSLALQVMEKFSIHTKFLLDVVTLSATSTSKIQEKVFRFLHQKLDPSERQDLSPIALAICWKALLKGMKERGSKDLIYLLSNAHFIELLDQEETKHFQPVLLRRLLLGLINTVAHEERKKKAWAQEIIESKLPILKSPPSKILNRLKFIDLLLLGDLTAEAIDQLKLVISIVKDKKLEETFGETLDRQISYVYACTKVNVENPENDLHIKRIDFLYFLKQHQNIPFSELPILKYLSKFPKEYLDEKAYYLQALLDLKRKKSDEQVLLLILQQLIKDYYAISSARTLLNHPQIKNHLKHAVVQQLKIQASISKTPPFVMELLGPESEVLEKKMDDWLLLCWEEIHTKTKLKKKKAPFKEAIDKEFKEIFDEAKKRFCPFNRSQIIQGVAVLALSGIALTFLDI